MRFVPIIYLWKLVFFIKLVQCGINSTLNKLMPSLIIRPYPDVRLTEQVMYDWENTRRKEKEMNHVNNNNGDDDDDYLDEEDDIDIDIEEQTTTTTTVKLTTLKFMYDTLKTSKSCLTLRPINFLSLFLLLLLFTQRNI